MKNVFLVLGLSLLIISCAGVRVNYDYEKSTDFQAYKTYNYYKDMDMGMSELDGNRLLDAMDAEMQAMGLTLSNTPDFLINIKSSTYQMDRHNNVGVGVGGGGGHVGGGISLGIPIGQSKINREILFEFIDEETGLFWQARSEGVYRPNARPAEKEKQFQTLVEQVLSGYPPSSKK